MWLTPKGERILGKNEAALVRASIEYLLTSEKKTGTIVYDAIPQDMKRYVLLDIYMRLVSEDKKGHYLRSWNEGALGVVWANIIDRVDDEVDSIHDEGSKDTKWQDLIMGAWDESGLGDEYKGREHIINPKVDLNYSDKDDYFIGWKYMTEMLEDRVLGNHSYVHPSFAKPEYFKVLCPLYEDDEKSELDAFFNE